MHRILEETVRITTHQGDYNLGIRITPVIPSQRFQHFAARPTRLVSLSDKACISISTVLDSFGVTDEEAARACVKNVEQLLAPKRQEPIT
jgi:hypothetical protein